MGIGWSFARPLTAAAMIDMFLVTMVVGCSPGCELWVVVGLVCGIENR